MLWMSKLTTRWGRLYLDKEDARERDALLLLAQTMNTIMVTHILVHFFVRHPVNLRLVVTDLS